MNNIVLKEKEYAEKILDSNTLDKKPTFDLRILAKYYCHEKKLTQNKIYLELVNVMEEKYNNFALSKWQPILLDLAKNAKKYKLIDIEYIPITKNELLTIDGIVSKPMKRLALTLLCLAKYRNIVNPKNNDWVGYKFKDIFKMANINSTKKEQGFMIHDMIALQLVRMNKMVNNLSINVCYVDKDNSEEVLQIKDFRNIGYEYLLYCGENFIRCKECGILVRQNKQSNKIFCTECNKYKPQETKTIKCIDCGKEIIVDGIVKNKKRCDKCQHKYNNSSRMKNYYKKKYQEGYLQKFDNNFYLLKDNPLELFKNGYRITQILNPDFDEWYNEDGSEIRYPFLVNFEFNNRNVLYCAKLIEGKLDFM